MTDLQFTNHTAFRKWLSDNCTTSNGIWLVFGKKGSPTTLSATEALEEALCFGWIDGQMQSIDDKTYARAYCDPKTDARREKRLAWVVNRLNQNLRPM